MTYRVTIYCPDRHIVYDGRTPREKGVGGGITARIRMAHALQRRGHRVTMVVNCPRRETFEGVEYVPLDEARDLVGDVVILNTSGGDLDLSPALDLRIESSLRFVWVQGTPKPGAVDQLQWDSVYAVSNFIGGVALDRWGIPADRVFVTYNAFEESLFARAENHGRPRDPYRLVYFSHPSKGLETALAVLERLRSKDPRFHLKILGGEALWGGEGKRPDLPEGASFEGLTGQAVLADELLRAGFSLQMQDREEPGALAIMEAFRAGCVIVASPVGCYPEMIADGRNGLIIQGDHSDSRVRDEAARRILELMDDPVAEEGIRRQAIAVPWSSDRLAEVWTGHWDWLLHAPTDLWRNSTEPCRRCGGEGLVLADGAHCLSCSFYQEIVKEPVPIEGTA
jgi:glycosyltransferase involved in cell wall biosynthesis